MDFCRRCNVFVRPFHPFPPDCSSLLLTGFLVKTREQFLFPSVSHLSFDRVRSVSGGCMLCVSRPVHFYNPSEAFLDVLCLTPRSFRWDVMTSDAPRELRVCADMWTIYIYNIGLGRHAGHPETWHQDLPTKSLPTVLALLGGKKSEPSRVICEILSLVRACMNGKQTPRASLGLGERTKRTVTWVPDTQESSLEVRPSTKWGQHLLLNLLNPLIGVLPLTIALMLLTNQRTCTYLRGQGRRG